MILLLGVLKKLHFKLAKLNNKDFILRSACKVISDNEVFVSNILLVYSLGRIVRCKDYGCETPHWRY